MTTHLQIGIIGDYDSSSHPQQATASALHHSAAAIDVAVQVTWLPTESLDPLPQAALQAFDALWCAPGSPYRSMVGALTAIRFARESGRPLLGTCGGFQHIVIEYARDVLGFEDAQHAEYDPSASILFVTPLSCSLVGQTMQVMIEPDARAGRAYGQRQVEEHYYCRFGLNPAYQTLVHDGGLRIVGVDQDGEPRIVELPEHPFFIGTLFVPQVASTPERPHPLVTAYVDAARCFHESRPGVAASVAGTA